jgi:hypothetical protein
MLALGVRLLLLARRTRALPELLLGLHFVLCCALGYALAGTGHALGLDPAQPRALVTVLLAVGHAASVLGVGSALVFNWWVFRRDEGWARALALALGAALAGGWIGYATSDHLASGAPSGAGYWLLYAAYTSVGLWVLVEPLRFWRTMRKRQRLGLAEPRVVDRFLLWGVGSAARFAMLLVGAVAMTQVTGAASDVAALAPLSFLGSASFGLVVAGAYWLAFFPPQAYRRFAAKRA